jgi:hypothetical protein
MIFRQHRCEDVGNVRRLSDALSCSKGAPEALGAVRSFRHVGELGNEVATDAALVGWLRLQGAHGREN